MEGTRRVACAGAAWLIAMVLACGLCGFVQRAHAADLTAGSLGTQATSSKTESGTIKSGGKVTKTFTMPKKGYVTFTVRVPKGLGYTSIKIDNRDVRYVDASVSNGSMPAGKDKYVSKRFSFKPGSKIKVTLELPRGVVSQKLSYKVTMKKSAPKRYESELNNKKSTADKLTTSGAYSGNIIKKDTDWFVFKAPANGTYRFSGKIALVGDTQQLDTAIMTLYKGKKAIATSYPVAGNGYVTMSSVPMKKGQKLYVKVTPITSITGNVASGAGNAVSNVPSNLGNLPSNLGNLPAILGNLPTSLGNLPTNLGNLPGGTGNLGASANDSSSSSSTNAPSSSTNAVSLPGSESVNYGLRVVKTK